MAEKLPAKLIKITTKPGVYYFYDKNGKILYIGKAKNLKNRVNSYFRKSADLAPDKKILIQKIKKINYTVVSNETEALLLESTLIKKHQPPYNIILKDDKYWQYIKVNLAEPFPRITTVRKIDRNKNSQTGRPIKYFGPYTSGLAVRQTMWLIKKIFPLRNCNRKLVKLPDGKVCLQYHLGLCLGPCEKLISQNDYLKLVKLTVDFLNGRMEKIIRGLTNKMKQAATEHEFEKAKIYRDQIQALEKLKIKQKVVAPNHSNQDYFNLYRTKDEAVVTLFQIRDGKLLNQSNFFLKRSALFSDQEIIEQTANQYYTQTTDLPREIIVPNKIKTIKKVLVPQKGKKKNLLDLVKTNAQEYYQLQLASWEKKATVADKKLIALKTILRLDTLPLRIEGYDISNLGGQQAVGSMVVMTNGKLDKSQYRRFKIKTINQANDPAMIGEIIKRRLKNNWTPPDLILVDGGKPQLTAALSAIKNQKIKIISLAKKQEEIYLPGQKLPLKLVKFSPALQLLQQLRDEAHRFAINYHRRLKRRANQDD